MNIIPIRWTTPGVYVLQKSGDPNNPTYYYGKVISKCPDQDYQPYSQPVQTITQQLLYRPVNQRDATVQNPPATLITENSDAAALFKMLDDYPLDDEGLDTSSSDSENYHDLIDELHSDLEGITREIGNPQPIPVNHDANPVLHSCKTGMTSTNRLTPQNKVPITGDMTAFVAQCLAQGDMKAILQKIEAYPDPKNNPVTSCIQLLLKEDNQYSLAILAENIAKKLFNTSDDETYNRIMNDKLFSKLYGLIIQHMDKHLSSINHPEPVWIYP